MVAACEAWKRSILWLEPCSGCFLVGLIPDKIISELRLLAQLTREPVSSDFRPPSGAPMPSARTINTRFGQARSLGDAILFKFGPLRRRNPAMRHHLSPMAASVAVALRDADRIIQISSPSA